MLLIRVNSDKSRNTMFSLTTRSGADPGFQVRGAHLKKLRRAEGGAKISCDCYYLLVCWI
jgi:hypothetical protein